MDNHEPWLRDKYCTSRRLQIGCFSGVRHHVRLMWVEDISRSKSRFGPAIRSSTILVGVADQPDRFNEEQQHIITQIVKCSALARRFYWYLRRRGGISLGISVLLVELGSLAHDIRPMLRQLHTCAAVCTCLPITSPSTLRTRSVTQRRLASHPYWSQLAKY